MAANPAARLEGVQVGQSLADARALYPALAIRQADPAQDLKALDALSAACERYTPWVAIDPFGGGLGNGVDSGLSGAGLWLDITGCAHLFGGEEALLDDLLHRLTKAGYHARAGLAATAGAAWALARFAAHNQNPGVILPAGQNITAAIASLPMAGLRLDGDAVEGLERMGLRKIGDLYSVPRAPLSGRFGGSVLRRLDQALGALEETLSPRRPPPAFYSRLAFADPIGRREDIEAALARLLELLCADLEKSNQGARRLVLSLFRIDNTIVRVHAGTSRPNRDLAHLARLFQEELDKVDPGFGIDAVVLVATETNTLAARQTGLNGGVDDVTQENAAKLVDRLAGRLGPGNITRLQPIASHLPERANRETSASKALEDGDQDWKGPVRRPPRPLQLLTQPLPIDVMAPVPDGPPVLFRWRKRQHRVRAAEGPERITPEWWRIEGDNRDTRPLSNDVRDYYRVEDEEGKRFWLYREGLYRPDLPPTWYIHGFFA